jgi:NUMOD3 motif
MSNTIYYVYAYLRSKDSQTALAGTPYYIGYGKGQRAFNKHRIPVPKDKSNIIFLHENLSEDQAKELEIQEISRYGRKDLGTGILTNLTNGGEGVSGMIHSEETKKIMSEKKTGENNNFYGKTHSEEARKKISESKKGKQGPGNFRGKEHSEETKVKLSVAFKRRSKEDRNKFIKSAIGTKWFHNPITLEQIRIHPNNPPSGFFPGRIPKIAK